MPIAPEYDRKPMTVNAALIEYKKALLESEAVGVRFYAAQAEFKKLSEESTAACQRANDARIDLEVAIVSERQFG